MSNGMMVFNNDGLGEVRVVSEGDVSWFVCKDVAGSLGYAEGSNPARLFQAVPDEWKGVKQIHTPGGGQKMLCLTEHGLYFFLGRSDKPKALPYQKWIAGEVVPSIRKHGTYMTDSVIDQVMANPAIVYKMAETMLKERNLREIAEAKIKADEPKVKRSEAVMDLPDTISIGTMAAILKQKGLNMGQNKLFKALREHKFLLSQHDRYNHPAQKWINEGLFKLEEVIDERCGCVRYKTKVTGKGQVYLVDYFCSVQ